MNRAVMSTINIVILIAFLAATAGHAQVTIDVSKITCDQYVSLLCKPRWCMLRKNEGPHGH
jgi:hypothetical protein